MGYYDKPDARHTPLNVWNNGEALDFSHCYSASEAFEQAILDAKGNVVSKVVKGFTTFPPQHLSPFGLHYRVRRIADVDEIVEASKRKRERDAAAREAAKSYREVITLRFDKNWDLVGKDIETRTVYTNKSGGMRIKTRSNGSPQVWEHKDRLYVVYGPSYRGYITTVKEWDDSIAALVDKATWPVVD